MQVMCSCPFPHYQSLEVSEANRQTSFLLSLPTSLKIPRCQADYLLPYQSLVPRHRAKDDDSVTVYGTATAARAQLSVLNGNETHDFSVVTDASVILGFL